MHVPFLRADGTQSGSSGLSEKTVTLDVSLCSTDYCDWWRINQADVGLFGVRLIGDASNHKAYTAMACSDLSFARLVTALLLCKARMMTQPDTLTQP